MFSPSLDLDANGVAALQKALYAPPPQPRDPFRLGAATCSPTTGSPLDDAIQNVRQIGN